MSQTKTPGKESTTGKGTMMLKDVLYIEGFHKNTSIPRLMKNGATIKW
jgi:hypothetical protein